MVTNIQKIKNSEINIKRFVLQYRGFKTLPDINCLAVIKIKCIQTL